MKMVSLQYYPAATQRVKKCNLFASSVCLQSTGNCSPALTIASMLSDSCRTCCIHKAEGHTVGQGVLIAKPQTAEGT